MPFPLTPASASSLMADAARSAGDVVVMLRGITTDPRVSQAAKVEASAALAYLASGRGRVPSFIPVVGRIDDLAVAAFALRRLLIAAGEPVLRSHWRGTGRGLETLLALTSALAAPGGLLRRLAVAGAAASLMRDQRSVRPRGAPGRRPGFGRVVEGEVLARREERG